MIHDINASDYPRLLSITRYLVTGVSLFALDLLVVLTLVQLMEQPIVMAQLAGRTTGAVTGFFAHRHFTFRNSLKESKYGLLNQGSGYIIISLFTMTISPLVLLFFLSLTQGHLILAKIFNEVVLVIMTYISLRFVFRAKGS